jgi:Cu+-exporting ATPase
VGAAVVAAAVERGLEPARATDVQALVGLGIVGRVEGRRVAVGNEALMAAEGAGDEGAWRASGETAGGASRAARLRAEGQTVLFVAVDGQAAGFIGVADAIKDSAAAAVSALHGEGLRLVILTGDAPETAAVVARTLGIDAVRAGLRPADKADEIRRLREAGAIVAMAGDGINDAPALAAADVGIAMGTGSDVAIESAGVTLLKGDLRGLVRARRLSRATLANVRQNLFFAFVYNLLGVPVAAGLLYPWTGWLLSPMLASAAMALSSVSVIANALRLRRVEL